MIYSHPHISSFFKRLTVYISVLLLITISNSSISFAGIPTLNLRSLDGFVILAGSTVTGIPPVSVTGNVGLSPAAGSFVVGFDGTNVSGTLYVVDASGPSGSVVNATLLQTAKSDLTTAYNDAANRTPVPTGTFLNPGAGNIGGLNLVPGLYKFTGAAQITGADVTLTGNATDVWIFQIGSSLNIGSNIKIILAGGAQAANIFWQVSTSATLDSYSVFKGTILADQSVTLGTGASIEGRALAFTAAVTMASAVTTVKPLLLPIFTSDSTQARFASVVTGGNKIDTITVTNTGGIDLVISSVTSSNTFFSVSPTIATIAPLASRMFFVTFSPTSNGLQTGNIVFNHNAAIPSNTISVSGTGVSPIFSTNSSTVSFGNVLNNTTKRDSITVTNTGNANLIITNIASTNNLFTFTPSNGTYTILPAATMKFYFTFAPLVNGAQIGRMIFDNNTSKLKDTVFVTGTGVSPNFSSNSSTISFGNVRNETTKRDSITITNTGTYDLVISSITTSNGLFTFSPSGSTITPGLSQKYYVTFAPLVSGFQNGIIVFNSNTAKTKDTLFVNGTGVAPLFSSSSTVSFGNVRNLTTKMDSVTVTNTGTSDLIISGLVSSNTLFGITNSSATLAPNATKKYYFTFSPLVDGLQNGTVIFSHNGKKLFDTVYVNGRGVSPLFTINKTSINYGDTRTNSAKADAVIVTNTGTADLIISSVTSTNIYFYAEDGSATITPGASKTFFLAFNPINVGVQSGLLIFNHNALKNKDTVSVTGNGVKASFTPNVSTLNFGTIRTGTTKILPVTVTNNGTLSLRIYNINSTNSRFDAAPKSVEIAPGGSSIFYATFMPIVDGEQNGMLIFGGNGNQLYDTIFVTGVGATPSIVISPRTIDFGNVTVGSTKRDSITVLNNGLVDLNINFITSSNTVFTVTPTSGTVAMNTSKKFYVTFAPVASGFQYGDIVFTHDGSNTYDTVKVVGNGPSPTFSITPQNLDFGDVIIGQTKQKSVIVKNLGTSDLTISNIVSSDSHYTVIPFAGNIAPNATQEIFITFAPTLVGRLNAQITITHNAGNSIVNVTGVGIDTVHFTTIKDARNLPIGTEFIIEGIVTRTMGSYTSMQDSTAGITIIEETGTFFNEVQNGTIKMGDKYRIQGKISELNALKVIQGTNLIKHTLVSSNNQMPQAARLNLLQVALTGEKYESCLIRVENFDMDNGGDKTFQADYIYQTEDNSDKTNTVSLYIPVAANTMLDGTSINGFIGTFEGILGQSSSCVQCRFQMVPVLTTDLIFVPNSVTNDNTTGNNLFNNYPNPFQTTTNISYNIATTSNVKLTVLNIVGTEIATLVSGVQSAGNYNFIYNAPELENSSASNVYFYKLEVGSDMFIKKMIITK